MNDSNTLKMLKEEESVVNDGLKSDVQVQLAKSKEETAKAINLEHTRNEERERLADEREVTKMRRQGEIFSEFFAKSVEGFFDRYSQDMKSLMGKLESFVSDNTSRSAKSNGFLESFLNKFKFPGVQKIEGKVEAVVNFPDKQKVSVDFPDVQQVAGNVRAEVTFPELQKVSIENQLPLPDINIPEIPMVKMGKMNVVPIVGWDGQRLIPFGDPGSKGVQGDGKLYAAIKELNATVNTQSVFYTGRVIVTVSGSPIDIGVSTNIKNLVVQALKDNRDTIYITSDTGNDFELQPGQSLTVVIDNLSKIKIQGSYANDGVCYSAS